MPMPPWSYSSLTAFETCPKRYHLTRVAKLVREPESIHMKHGNEVHKALELRLKDKTPLPEKYSGYEKYAKLLDKPGVETETEVAFTRALRPCGFWDKSAWCRGKLDVRLRAKSIALVADWKTGKVKPESSQLELFAAFEMQSHPEVDTAKTKFIWLQHDKTTGEVYTRDQLPGIWESFIQRANRLEDAYEKDKWNPRPSGLCREWCPVGKKLCDFCGAQ